MKKSRESDVETLLPINIHNRSRLCSVPRVWPTRFVAKQNGIKGTDSKKISRRSPRNCCYRKLRGFRRIQDTSKRIPNLTTLVRFQKQGVPFCKLYLVFAILTPRNNQIVDGIPIYLKNGSFVGFPFNLKRRQLDCVWQQLSSKIKPACLKLEGAWW